MALCASGLNMSVKIKIKIPWILPRNPHALDAKSRKAGPMKDRRAPRKGTRNKQVDILDSNEE